MKTKLGVKLKSLFEMVDSSYEVIWDTCCDHGNLGLAFLETKKGKKVVFVDQVPKIIDGLSLKLQEIPTLQEKSYQLLCMPAQEIVLGNGNELLCICGVGGEVSIDILKALRPDCDLLLSPHYYLFEVRRFLRELGYRVVKEQLVFEGKFARELFLLSKNRGEQIELTPKKIIDIKHVEHLKYIEATIAHLEKKSENIDAIKLYKEIIKSI